ncbi:hypothetical protein EVAR_70060_1 [Eumeta japonica]|uniref:Uncharacterized protein n=1 Tax=Eumeta variegata TaxID=151549 RepID=A0A4C2AGT9_EUMVA|nr:hypothetical protein EVAR_70060_1 [Eumeta japonica]
MQQLRIRSIAYTTESALKNYLDLIPAADIRPRATRRKHHQHYLHGWRSTTREPKPEGFEIKNGANIEIDCPTKIRIKIDTRSGIRSETRSETEVRIESGTGNESGIRSGIYFRDRESEK